MPEAAEPKEAAEDVAVTTLGEGEETALGSMPLLDPADASESLAEESGFCETLDLGICFAAGTPVFMADGSTKPIETIQPGDQVLSAPEHDAEGRVALLDFGLAALAD